MRSSEFVWIRAAVTPAGFVAVPAGPAVDTYFVKIPITEFMAADVGDPTGLADYPSVADAEAIADAAVADHVAAVDPHGDRAYTDTEISGIVFPVTSVDGQTGAVDLTGDYDVLGAAAAAQAAAIAASQPLDADLTEIAGLSPANDDFIQQKAGVWTNRTPAQVAADLPLSSGPTLVAEGAAAGVALSTTPTEVSGLTLPTLVAGEMVSILFVVTVANGTASPASYTPVLRMNGNVLVTLVSPANIPASTTRTDRMLATIYCTGSPAQTAVAEYQRNSSGAVSPVGPYSATATESQTTPTVSLYITSSSAGASQTGTQVLACAIAFPP